MPFVIEDRRAIEAFAEATQPIELRSPDGRLLGQFVPVEPSKKMSFPEFGMTDEEIFRQDNDPNTKWYTADEVMERLRQLRKKA